MPRAINGFKICSNKDCEHKMESQPISNFNYRVEAVDKLKSICKDCENARNRALRQTQGGQKMLQRYRTSAKGSTTLRRYSHSPKGIAIQRAHKYKTTIEQMLVLGEKTHCEICKKEFGKNSADDKQCIDHNHLTGAVRGVICKGCNFALGKFRDNQQTIRNAAEYLAKYS